ncbi:rhodanese-related sulfurtransferase [Hyphomicrobium sp.]|uniref:oxygen-dependent tRNA uridine(34) hydroxylase TrhO n=1 Tax=Hyphomicrobium sp. TaxID=82 RepID=UPI0025C1FA13|nr:rhodanese-related sulfurtransferase [Hyphomicrobium sp.]MCC7252821.1 rhodanese-related sulfurtransferase [Hyphomicrobium sp.]
MSVTVTAFYNFVTLADLPTLRASLLAAASEHGIKGTILIAPEGINATIAGPDEGIRRMLAWLRADARFAGLASKESYADEIPFGRLKVRIKREIVTLRRPEADPSQQVGTYVKPEHWNALIEDPDVIVIDTRNAYEVGIGTFKRAVDPATRAFSEFPDFVAANLDPARHKRIAMFCTGGIRCEKASSYLVSQGFPEVYHLEGGILKYLETIPSEESLWQGECFVFDERVALEHGVKPGSHVMCRHCGYPVAAEGESAHAPHCPRCSVGDEL